MKNIDKFINESSKTDVIYFEKTNSNTYILWCSWSPGSGTTTYFDNLKKYLTDKSGDDHFDSNVDEINKWSIANKPIKSIRNHKLYEIPVYNLRSHRTLNDFKNWNSNDMEIWGGTIKPVEHLYMVISKETTGVSVIGFFKTKKEALGFIG